VRHGVARVAAIAACLLGILTQVPHAGAGGNAAETDASAGVEGQNPFTEVFSKTGEATFSPPKVGIPGSVCSFHKGLTGEPGFDGIPFDPNPIADPVHGPYYVLHCVAPNGRTSDTVQQFNPADPGDPAIALAAVAERVRASLPLPIPQVATSPPADKPQLVGLKTWLWLTSPYEATKVDASIPGITSTLIAEPYQLSWNPGDGDGRDWVDCGNSPGKAWDRKKPDATTTCGHTYINRSTVDSPEGAYSVTVEVHYRMTWQATNGEGGRLADLVRITTFPMLVHELQAVIQGGR
jgi:hypothetical protein